MPAELTQVSAELAPFPSEGGSGGSLRPHVRRPPCEERRALAGGGRACLLASSFFSRELRATAELLFLTEHSREVLLLSLVCEPVKHPKKQAIVFFDLLVLLSKSRELFDVNSSK